LAENRARYRKMGALTKCKPGRFSLEHTNPNLFDITQWSRTELAVSTWYMVYRVVWALLFVAIVTAFGINSNLGGKFWIFMTNQGVFLLTINYVIEASLVATRWAWERRNQDKVYHQSCSINWIYKISWIFSTSFFDIALFITIIYWGALHRFVVKNHLLKTDLAAALNFFVHGFNSISCIIDVFLTRRPIKFWHIVFPIGYGLSYMLFSVIYWAAGATGPCRLVHPDDLQPTCPHYIYPILDWDGHPEYAVLTVAVGLVVLPIIHFFWMGMARLRNFIFYRTLANKNPNLTGVHNEGLSMS